jgi:hypothetical protein
MHQGRFSGKPATTPSDLTAVGQPEPRMNGP